MATLLEYKCPHCGGKIEFDSGLQQMKCPYCESVIDVASLREFDAEPTGDKSSMSWGSSAGGQWQPGEEDGMRVYSCQSCGGEVVADENTGATACPYCGNPVIMTGQFAGALRPDRVIPFKLDKEAAKAALNRHLQKKMLLPKAFKSQNHIDEIKGVYVPFWLFDAEVDASVRYRAAKVRSWSDSDYDYTETSYYDVRRDGGIAFDHVPVDGSSKMPDDLMESVEPFDYAQAVDFQTAYLSGYLADKYDVGERESVDRANQRVDTSTRQAFASTVTGFSSVTPESSDIRLRNGRAQYALYPVWLLNTTWNNKKYLFAMNGQTGKFVGDLPVDKGAYWKWFGILTAAAAFATLVVSFAVKAIAMT